MERDLCVREFCTPCIQSFLRTYSLASRTIKEASVGLLRNCCRYFVPMCCSMERHCWTRLTLQTSSDARVWNTCELRPSSLSSGLARKVNQLVEQCEALSMRLLDKHLLRIHHKILLAVQYKLANINTIILIINLPHYKTQTDIFCSRFNGKNNKVEKQLVILRIIIMKCSKAIP